MASKQHNIFRRTLGTLILAALLTPLEAQRNLARGDRYFDLNMFEDAIVYYEKDVDSRKKQVSQKAMQRLADCYRITGKFSKAEETYKKILSRKKKDPASVLNYGLALKNSAKYAEAVPVFEEYIRMVPDDKMGPVYLRSCDSAQKWLDETIGREVKNLKEINTSESDFSPVVMNGQELVFSSSRKGSTKQFISFGSGSDITKLDLYRVPLSNIETGSRKNKFIENFNEINTYMHEGPSCFSRDGKELYFTRTVKGKRDTYTNEVIGTLQVFYCVKDSTGKWSKPASAFNFNSLKYSVGHPSLSRDGRTIYFMSDMPGGYGKADIWFATRQKDGEWSKATNAGPLINTFGNELFPAISGDGYLFFSSNGHPGMGQLDIFRARLQGTQIKDVSNLKPPVNSIGNDFGITFYRDHRRGFFSSDRFNGKGSEDIYCYTEEVPIEIIMVGDTLMIPDYSLFDDVSYQLQNENESKNIDLIKAGNYFKARLDMNKTYVIESQRYGLIENEILLKLSRNTDQKFINYTLATSKRNIAVSGTAYVGIWKKGEKPDFDTKKTYSSLSKKSLGDLEMGIDKKGNFIFNVELEPGKQSVISSRDVIRFEEN